MTSQLTRSTGNTLEFTITLAWPDIESSFDRIFAALLAEVELPGFRKGKAPKELAEKQIDRTKVYEEVLKELIPKVYADAVKEHKARPIISPKVEVLEADQQKDWKVKIVTCEKPTIKLGDYKGAVAQLQKTKKQKIWVPGEAKDKKADDALTVGELLDSISTAITVELSPLLLEQEVNRMLSNIVSETQRLGMTVEQYLQAQGKTSDQLREEYKDQAQKTLGLEFALEEISDQEKVEVSDDEVENFIKDAKTEAEKEAMRKQKYYISSILRRQKTLSQLLKPAIVTA